MSIGQYVAVCLFVMTVVYLVWGFRSGNRDKFFVALGSLIMGLYFLLAVDADQDNLRRNQERMRQRGLPWTVNTEYIVLENEDGVRWAIDPKQLPDSPTGRYLFDYEERIWLPAD